MRSVLEELSLCDPCRECSETFGTVGDGDQYRHEGGCLSVGSCQGGQECASRISSSNSSSDSPRVSGTCVLMKIQRQHTEGGEDEEGRGDSDGGDDGREAERDDGVGRSTAEDADAHGEAADLEREDLRQHQPHQGADRALHAEHEQPRTAR